MTAKHTADTFWARVNRAGDEECWEWSGATNSGGYGTLSWHDSSVVAHRVAYMLEFGGIEPNTPLRTGGGKTYAQFVLHKCDNRRCCNPRHLFLGTSADNLYDAYIKQRKRQPKSKHANAKLTEADVVSIRREYVPGEVRQVDLAKKYGVSQRVISLVVNNRTYTDV